ncbi:MAG: nucleotidyltransferase domain-containing protein [Candidatus Falkowbacteria bacterium]
MSYARLTKDKKDSKIKSIKDSNMEREFNIKLNKPRTFLKETNKCVKNFSLSSNNTFKKVRGKSFKNKLKKHGVVLAYLYGSCARGDAMAESDVDIAILLDKKIKEEKYLNKTLKLSALFSNIYPDKEIGILILNQTTPLLKQNAIVEGKELYIADKFKKVMFENKALHEYEDTKKLRNIYNYFLNLRIENI